MIGVDAGGTKTLGIAATLAGQVIAVHRSGPGNYQTAGVDRARESLRECIGRLVEGVCTTARGDGGRCLAAYFAVAGADRPNDFAVIMDYVRDVVTSVARCDVWRVDNDALAALALGADDGAGVVVICGTGANCVGVGPGPDMVRVQIGGLGPVFGDAAGGSEIGMRAYAAAVRYEDGRGRPTALASLFRTHLGLQNLMELADVIHAGKAQLSLADLAPLVIGAAERGDEVSVEILTDCGRELGVSALAALRRLYGCDESVPVVLTGGVVRNPNPVIRDAAARVILDEYPHARVIVLMQAPALGSVVNAARLAGVRVGREWTQLLGRNYDEFTECGAEKAGARPDRCQIDA